VTARDGATDAIPPTSAGTRLEYPPRVPSTITADDLARLALTGPRYTSYPPATEFSDAVGAADAGAELRRLGATDAALSLYAHLPFCRSLCWYCGCNVVATRDRSRGTSYVDTLLTELATVAGALGRRARVTEIALGGGSPNFLLPADLARLVAGMERHFAVAADARRSVELDPRDTTLDQLDVLAEAGFASLSIGVQDFAEEVQAAIHRTQSVAATRALVEEARRRGFADLNLDIVYGLPGQTPESFAATLDAVISMAPDRIALFGYAHLPDRRPHQLLVVRQSRLPDLRERAVLLLAAVDQLTAAGYVHVGLDHFARPGSAFAAAAQGRRLDRTFQGYVERRADAVIGVGATAISTSDHLFWQNAELEAWTTAVTAGALPVARGVVLGDDDRVRRQAITRLMCDGEIDLAELEPALGEAATDHFARELVELSRLPALCAVDGPVVKATRLGQLLVRNLCLPFDRYLPQRRGASFSSTI
jgi:oxygen-independent coproporphyrinogen-3 oxidase